MNISVSMQAETLFTLFGMRFTNAMMGSVAVTLVCLLIIILLRNPKIIPSRIQLMFEFIFEHFYDLFTKILGDEKETRKYFWLLMTIFLFVFLSNFISYIPLLSTISYTNGESTMSLFREPSADTSFTLGFTFGLIIFSNLLGFIKSPLKKFFAYIRINKIKEATNPMGIMNFFIEMFLGVMDIIGEFAKVMSMGFRLFGNIFGGGVLLLVVSEITKTIIPGVPLVLVPFPFLILSTFSGLVQAYVYTMLSTIALKSGSSVD